MTGHVEAKKVLNPNLWQEFDLREKTVLSHNVAMYVVALRTSGGKKLNGLAIGSISQKAIAYLVFLSVNIFRLRQLSMVNRRRLYDRTPRYHQMTITGISTC